MHDTEILGKYGDVVDANRRQGFRDGVDGGCNATEFDWFRNMFGVLEVTESEAEVSPAG